MHASGLVILGLVVIGYALVAAQLERESVGGPVVFTLAGLILGPLALGILDPSPEGLEVRLLAELTLALRAPEG